MVSTGASADPDVFRLRVEVRGEYQLLDRAVTQIALPSGQTTLSNRDPVALGYSFAVFWGPHDLVVGLRQNVTVVERVSTDDQTIRDVKVNAFDNGRAAVIRVLKRGPNGRNVSAGIYVVQSGQLFRFDRSLLEELETHIGRVPAGPNVGTRAPLHEQIIELFRNDIQQAHDESREPTLFHRHNLAGIDDLNAVIVQGRPIEPATLSFPIRALPAPSVIRSGTVRAPGTALVTTSSRAATPSNPPTLFPEIKANDERGVQKPASEIVRRFTLDLVAESVRLNWAYDDIPWLRELEDQALRALNDPSAGSVLISGPSGVGKDELKRRIAVRIARGDVPDHVKGRHFWQFDVGSIMGGTSLRGQAEARMLAVIALSGTGQFLWSVPEAHGFGRTEFARELQDIAKPALASGTMKWIADSTRDEWPRFITDDAFRRRFARVDIAEPSGERLMQIVNSWWRRHGFGELPRDVAEQAVRLADLYATEGAQPSRTTKLLSTVRASRDANSPPVTVHDLENGAIERWRVPRAEFVPAERLARHDALVREIDENVIGQDEAKRAVAQADRNALARVRNPRLPAIFVVFLGTEGVGKTEMAMARVINGDREITTDNDPRIMLSNYKTPAQVAALRREIARHHFRNPHGLVILDEADKTTSDVEDVLLSIGDSGTLTVDETEGTHSKSKTYFVNNMKFVIIANSATEFIRRLAGEQGGATRSGSPIGFQVAPSTNAHAPARVQGQDEIERTTELRQAAVADGMSRYVLDRSDRILAFFPPSREEFERVLRLQIARALSRIATHGGLRVEIANQDDMARELANAFWRPGMSNRDAVRAVSRTVDDTAANARFELERALVATATSGVVREATLIWERGGLALAGPEVPFPTRAEPRAQNPARGLACHGYFAQTR